MKDKGHFYTSLIKSGIHMVSWVIAFFITPDVGVKVLAAGMFVAELFGVFEEVFDKR